MVSEFFCAKIFSQNLFKSPLFSSSEVQTFPLFCFYGKRKNSKELNDCSIKNRVKRHEKTSFPAGSRFSGTAFPNIFGDESAIGMCTHSRGLPARSFTTPRRQAVCCPPAELDGDCFCQFLCKAFPKKNEIQKGFAQPMYK